MSYKKNNFAEVIVDYPGSLQKTYSYIIPISISAKIGQVVEVPFGSRSTLGIIKTLNFYNDKIENLKYITRIINPHLYSTSILNFGIIAGALASALMAKQFQVRSAPTRELSKAVIGGTLMGIGASLSFGCNIGGFFSAISALSMSGVAMMCGLIIGSLIGLKLLVWEITYMSPSTSPVSKDVLRKQKKNQPLLGMIILLVGILLAIVYDELDYSIRSGFLIFGLMIGIIMQRTRFCFVRAFREPFMTGDGSASKAVALAVIISVIGFSILKWSDMKDWEAQVFAGFWFGSLVG